MDIIFDNGGGVTLQTQDYVHYYDDIIQAARDFKTFLEDGNTDGWEGHEEDMRIYSESVEEGGYRLYEDHQAKEQIEIGEIESSWHNETRFFVALGCKDLNDE